MPWVQGGMGSAGCCSRGMGWMLREAAGLLSGCRAGGAAQVALAGLGLCCATSRDEGGQRDGTEGTCGHSGSCKQLWAEGAQG